MILQEDDIAKIFRDRPNKAWLHKLREYGKHAKMHMTGEGKAEAMQRIDYFEDERILIARQLYGPSNKDFYERLHRPIDKIWTAKGGSINFSLPDNQKRKMNKYVSNVKNGYSLVQWLQTYWLPACMYDPMGLIMLEVGNNETYPVYHSLETIFEMPHPKGRRIDWLIFKLSDDSMPQEARIVGGNIIVTDKMPNMPGVSDTGAAQGYYRVVDDLFDRTVYWNGATVTEIPELTYPNYYMEVPAITAGSIWDNARKMFVSIDDATLSTQSKDEMSSIADKYMRERSVLTIFEMQHGFPLSWQYESKCSKCNGAGKISSYGCDSCNGTGKESKKDASKLMSLPWPKDKNDPIVSAPAGSVEAPVESWQEMKRTNEETYKSAHYCTWGTHQIEDNSKGGEKETATGRFIDVQPVNDRLSRISEMAEFVYMWVSNMSAMFMFGVSDDICDANFGRRYLIETPDEISKRLQDAIKNKLNYSFLRDLYMRWIDSEYSGDEMTRQRLIMEFKLDPQPFMSAAECKEAYAEIDPDAYQTKLFYGQWLESLPNNWHISNNYEYWKSQRDAYVKKIIAAQPEIEPEAEPAIG